MKKFTKKITVLILAGIMAMSFSACDSTSSSSEDNSSEAAVVNNDNGGDESAPAAMNENSSVETFKDYSNKTVENGKSASWLWIDNGVEDIMGDGEIFEISFKIKDDVADGNYNIVINELQICNKDLEVVEADIIDGTVTVGSASAPSQESASGNSIILENVSGNAGDDIKMKVKLSSNPGFCTIQLGINYDSSALEITDVTNVGLIDGVGSVSKNLEVD
jgi:hypothetical protein